MLFQTKGKKPEGKKRRIKKKEDGQALPRLSIQGEGFSKITFGKVDMSPIDKPQMSDLDALLNLQTAPAGSNLLSPHASPQVCLVPSTASHFNIYSMASSNYYSY